MNRLADFLLLELAVFVYGTAALVFFRILTGKIVTRGLLNSDETGRISAERVQALTVTIGLAGYIVVTVLTHPYRIPEIPEEAMLLAFGSQLGYLGFKGRRILFDSSQSRRRNEE